MTITRTHEENITFEFKFSCKQAQTPLTRIGQSHQPIKAFPNSYWSILITNHRALLFPLVNLTSRKVLAFSLVIAIKQEIFEFLKLFHFHLLVSLIS